MTDTGTTVTVGFTQKVSEAPYETADYHFSITRTYPDSFDDAAIKTEVEAMWHDAKMEVLRQAGQEFSVGEDERVMRLLKSGVARPDTDRSAAAPPPAPSGGPTAASAQAPPVAPAAAPVLAVGGGGKVYPRVDFCVGKQAAVKQAAWNLLAFQPNEWSDGQGGATVVYEVKEHADGTTDTAKSGKNFPNFSVRKEALQHIGVQVSNNVGLWINDGDSNVPLKVWDQANGKTQADAEDFQWESRREALQAYAYGR